MEPRDLLATFLVTTLSDSGAGSLRSAITAANAAPNVAGVLDSIKFSIPGTGPHVIALTSALPTITDPVEIDGYSQGGAVKNTNAVDGAFNGVLKIVLDGSATPAGTNGLVIDAGNTEVSGLVISRFPASGIRITSNSGNIISGNFIGTDVTGTLDHGNGSDGIQISDVRDNRIGGLLPEDRNVISGNGSDGIEIRGVGSASNFIQGNFIGVDKTGANVLANASDGVAIQLGAGGNQIGGTTAAERNIISGNGSDGVEIEGATSTGNQVLGNYIGTDLTGTLDRGNLVDGVAIVDSPGNTIGGESVGHRNIISGNEDDGVQILGLTADNNIVRGNFIGTDATGTADLGNRSDGVSVTNGAGSAIGGASAFARNVISGNGSDGVKITGAGATASIVQGNYIGTDITGNADLGNDGDGIRVSDGAASTIIGGTAAGTGNRIGFSNGAGIVLSATAGVANAIRGNAIFGSTALPIDLGDNGVTANDAAPDADTGPNRLQNFPVILTAMRGVDLHVTGSFDGAPNVTHRIELYANDASLGVANQNELQHLLTAFNITTNGAGHADFDLMLPNPSVGSGGDFITATATHSLTNDTSEASAPLVIAGDDLPPLAEIISAPGVGAAGGTSYDFVLRFTDASLVDRGSFNTGDIRVTSVAGFNQLATFVSASSAVDAASIDATYRITPPGGAWDGFDNSVYTIALEPSQVRDTLGNGVAVATPVGTFNVSVSVVTVSVAAMDGAAAETVSGDPADTATFRITRTSTAGALTVKFSRAGTATFGATGDYTLSVNGTPLTTLSVVIPDGEDHVDILVTPRDDTAIETTETVILNVVAGASYVLDPDAADRTATVTITDNEALVTIAALDSEAAETGAGDLENTAAFRISRSGSTTNPLTVTVSRTGTATFGATGDYTLLVGGITLTASPKSIVIPAGEDHVDVIIVPVDNALVEVTETVVLTLPVSRSYRTDAVAANRSVTANILDNEPTVTIAAVDASASEAAGDEPADPGVIRISRTGNLTAPLTVKFTRKGSARHGATSDYTLAAGGLTLSTTSVVIPAGESHVDVSVNPVDNAVVEPVETVIVTLATASTYKLDAVVANRSATVNVLDNEPLLTIEVIDALAGEMLSGDALDTGIIRISRSGSTLAPLTARFTRGGTATFGATRDYIMQVDGVSLTATTVVIPAGADHVDILILPVDNLVVEPVETVTITLATSTAYNLVTEVVSRSGLVNVQDND